MSLTIPSMIAGIVWQPAIPAAVIVMIGLVLGFLALRVYAGARSRGLLGRPQRYVLLLLRLAAILGICAILFNPMLEEFEARRIAQRVLLVGIDKSKSMAVQDSDDQATRLDSARRMILESGLLDSDEFGDVRLFAFDEDAQPLESAQLPSVEPDGETTIVHQSVRRMMEDVRTDENGVGLFLFSDGHDFQMITAKRTGQFARSRQIPIYPIVLGKDLMVPDISVSIASYQPHTFIKQRVRIQANLRLLGSESRSLQVDLLREGEILRSRNVFVEVGQEVPVSFDVGEDTPGQYEYEIRTSPLPGEKELENNKVLTFLNVSDAKVPVLLVEGSPHWDSTFLRRTLLRNSRIEMTSIVALGDGAATATGPGGVAAVPKSEADFGAFPLIILGRSCERVFDQEAMENLRLAVEKGGSVLVFARGNPGVGPIFDELAPAPWIEEASGPVRLVGGRSGGQIVPVDVLASAPGGAENLPELPVAQRTEKLKTLSAVEAMAEAADDNERSPAFVHRRQGRGQVLAVTVGGTWKWSLNAKSESTNNVYDRFWNQLVLNLIAQSRGALSTKSAITMNSANIALGEQAVFSLHLAPGTVPPVAPRLSLYLDNTVQSEIPLAQSEEGGDWIGTMVAEEPGRFRGSLKLGEEELECRFAVYREQRESTEVSADKAYLRNIAMASGGRLLDASSLKATIAELAKVAEAEADAPSIVRRRTLWDRTIFFYVLFGILGLEWALRRRWGLT